MYHIKKDKRSQTSAAEIAKGLHQCLKTIPMNAVTVSDIHRATGISRATFYRLFDTPEDVLIYQCDLLIDKTLDKYINDGAKTPIEAFEKILSIGMENHALLESLVENRRFDLLHEYTAKRIFSFTVLRDMFAKDMEESEIEYVTSNLAMSMVATLTTWVRRGRVDTPTEVIQHTKKYWSVVNNLLNAAGSEQNPDH